MFELDNRSAKRMRAGILFYSSFFLPLILSGVVGCGANPVTLNYDAAYDFSSIQRYAFVSRERMQANFLLSDVQRNRIEYVIEQQLDKRGLRYAQNSSEADVLISYTLINHHRLIGGKQLNFCEFCNAQSQTSSTGQAPSRKQQRDGTLVITMLENHQKQQIWQVSLAANLLQNDKNELDKERLEETVEALFTQWPVLPGDENLQAR